MSATVVNMPSTAFETFGLLDISSAGIAAELTLSKPLDIAPGITTTMSFELDMNSTGQLVTINIPTIPSSFGTNTTALGSTAYTISATPSLAPNFTGAYVEFIGTGNITLLDSPLDITGQVGIVVSATGALIEISGQMSLGSMFNSLAVGGTLAIDNVSGQQGVYGNLYITGTLMSSSVFSLKGNFELQFNSTVVSQNVQGLDSNNALTTVSIAATSLQVDGNATFKLADIVSMYGSADLSIITVTNSTTHTSTTTIQAAIDMSLGLGVLGNMNVIGDVLFQTGSGGTVFAMYVSTNISFGGNQYR